jgi:hypothetical protein
LSGVQIWGSGSAPKCHGSPTLVKPMTGKNSKEQYVKIKEFENCLNEEIVCGILV